MDYAIVVQMDDSLDKLQHDSFYLSEREELALSNHSVNHLCQIDVAVFKNEKNAFWMRTHDDFLELHNVFRKWTDRAWSPHVFKHSQDCDLTNRRDREPVPFLVHLNPLDRDSLARLVVDCLINHTISAVANLAHFLKVLD
jgi:hypothetical protein